MLTEDQQLALFTQLSDCRQPIEGLEDHLPDGSEVWQMDETDFFIILVPKGKSKKDAEFYASIAEGGGTVLTKPRTKKGKKS